MADSNLTTEKLEETELALLIGKITMHWNQLQDAIRFCFPAALGGDSRFSGAVLDAIKSDDTQRNVVLATIQSVLVGEQHEALKAEASRLFSSIGRLAGQRNGFVHSSWTRQKNGPIEVSAFLKKPHGAIDKSAPIQQGMELLRQIDILLTQILALGMKLQSATTPQSHHPQSSPSSDEDQVDRKAVT